jgi:hypothetical protein
MAGKNPQTRSLAVRVRVADSDFTSSMEAGRP